MIGKSCSPIIQTEYAGLHDSYQIINIVMNIIIDIVLDQQSLSAVLHVIDTWSDQDRTKHILLISQR